MREEEKLQLAKEWYNDQKTTEEEKSLLEKLFPEFRDSEDEKIRKWIMRELKSKYIVDGIVNNDMADKAYAWLEKQTIDISSFPEEQRKYMEKYVNLNKTTLVKLLAERDENIEESLKASICDECEHPTLNCGNFPCDKVKPKFKVGNWVVHNETGTIYQVKEIVKLNCGYAYNLTDGGYISSFKSNEYHLWTIQDAKDGDILAVNDTVVIFKDLHNSSTFHSYCRIEDGVFNISKDDMPDWWRCEGFKPANIEQGELLFKTMNEAGYVWDSEKKMLIKIEQKTVPIGLKKE